MYLVTDYSSGHEIDLLMKTLGIFFENRASKVQMEEQRLLFTHGSYFNKIKSGPITGVQ
jgi:hypothetical protein